MPSVLPGKMSLARMAIVCAAICLAMLTFVAHVEAAGFLVITGEDVSLGRHPNENLEISVVDRNLLEPEHSEFSPTFVNTSATQVERSIYGSVSYTF